ncbi:MAG: endonuclease/exonuclease/phosphatase family protein [Nocardioides sp.]
MAVAIIGSGGTPILAAGSIPGDDFGDWSQGPVRPGKRRRWRKLVWLLIALLVLPAMAVTASRVLPAENWWTSIGPAFVPLAIPLYAICLVLLLGLTIRKPRRLAVTAVVVIGGLLACHAVWIAPHFTSELTQTSAETPTLRLMTINSYVGAADADEIVAAADSYDVDVLVVVEITWTLARRLKDGGLEQRFGHQAGIGEHRYEGTTVYSREPLGNPTGIPTRFDSFTVGLELDGQPVTLLVAHPGHPLLGASDWREEQAAIESAAEGADLLAGDFNATLDHRPMRRLEDLGFRSAAQVAGVGWAPTWPNGRFDRAPWLPVPRLLQLDHILIQKSWGVADVRRVAIAGTDHTGVYAELTPPPSTDTPGGSG